MDPTGSESTLNDLEPSTPASYQAFLFVELDIVVEDFAVSLGCIVVSKDLHGTDDLDSRVVGGDEDDGESLVTVGVLWVGETCGWLNRRRRSVRVMGNNKTK